MTEMVLVSCSKTKRDGVNQARYLYEPSPIFRKRVQFAAHRDAHMGILSARFGYLRPWDVTPNYDTHIDERTAVWAAVVLRDLLRDLDFLDVEVVTMLAGRKYVDPLVTPLEGRGYDLVDFNRGKMPGQRMQALDESVAPGDQQELIPATDGGPRRYVNTGGDQEAANDD